jgi:replicative DNA helicase
MIKRRRMMESDLIDEIAKGLASAMDGKQACIMTYGRMTSENCCRFILATMTNVSAEAFANVEFTEEERSRLKVAADKLAGMPLFIEDRSAKEIVEDCFLIKMRAANLEECMIGGCLLDPSRMQQAIGIIGSRPFVGKMNAKVWGAMTAMRKDGLAIDLVPLHTRLGGIVSSKKLAEYTEKVPCGSAVCEAACAWLATAKRIELTDSLSVEQRARVKLIISEAEKIVASEIDNGRGK